MKPFCRTTLALALMLQLLISINNDDDMLSFITRAEYGKHDNSGAASASPLAGTKIRQPWQYPSTSGLQPGRRYTPSVFDVYRNPDLTKLLDVGACINPETDVHGFSYVPPLDGTNANYKHTLCQQIYGMRFVLFDLKLVNIDTVDSLSGSFTAQFQLVFHWIEGWEALQNDTDTESFAYLGDEIETDDNATLCGFDCDSTEAVKTMCCDRMWVPPLQVPSCKVNDVQSVTPPPYLTTTYEGNQSSYWPDAEGNYTDYSTRRKWYVGLDVTCPFTPEFRNFPFDYQFLTVDIVNPYASRTWLQLNKGFLEANIVDSIAGINLFPDNKIDGWKIKDLIVSSACGTQQTWEPTFLTQDYLLDTLGDGYESQSDAITALLKDIKCAEMKNIISKKDISLSNPTSQQPYDDTWNDYMERLDATVTKYEECTKNFKNDFQWKNLTNYMPDELVQFNLMDGANMNRSFSFLDLQYPKEASSDAINFHCVIDAIANLTTPGIRINIIVQRFKTYYIVKLFLPTCACVAFSFTSFALDVDELLGRLTVVVPSAIALSALQGYVVATDIPVVAYIAPTTYVILLSYAIQLLIALESICFKLCPWFCLKIRNRGSTHHQSNKPLPLLQYNEKADALDPQFDEKTREVETPQSRKTKGIEMVQIDQLHLNDQEREVESLKAEKKQSKLSGARIIDLICCVLLLVIYISFLTILARIPLQHAKKEKENSLPSGYQSLWNSS